MSVQSMSGSYSAYQKPGYSRKWTSSATKLNGSVSQTNYVSQYNNVCTDGLDDGNIGLGAKAGCIGKGILQTGKNMLKGMIQHPFKTALMIGASFIPVVGPLVIAGTAAYGIYNGAKTIMNGVAVANNATNDAEAKDAWENIGVGGTTTLVSAVALKGATGALRNQLSGGSSTVQAYRDFKAGKAELSDVLKEGVNDTSANIKGAVDAVKTKYNEIFNKENGGVTGYIKGKIDKLSDKTKSFIDKHSKKTTTDTTEAKIDAKKAIEKQVESLKKTPGVKKSGSGYELKEGNVTTKFNSKGEPVSKVTVDGNKTITETFKNGDIEHPVTRTTETKTGDKVTWSKTEKFGREVDTTINKAWDPVDKKYTTNKYYSDKGTSYTSKELSAIQKLDMGFRNSNLGLGENVQFGKITMPFTRSTAYGASRFTLPSTYVEQK